ncbi:MAG: CPBP family intramembrane metalloprotease [Ruminococcaceae bacterium]|nr:CPBP family intramembrane metalloprotease [Oscillospiraceae bacterium]
MDFNQNENTEALSQSNVTESTSENISQKSLYIADSGSEADTRSLPQAPDMMRSYKTDCYKLGFYLTSLLLLRIVAQGFSPIASRVIYSLTSNLDVIYALNLLYSALFLQIIPSFLGALMLKYSLKNVAGGFHVPKNSKKAFANFPAIYGAGMTINLITMGIILLVTGGGDINDSINSLGLAPPSIVSSVTLFIMLVVIAPLFEEFVFRGAVMNLLKPYGSGIAVFVSAFCFGIFHGNFQQFFYAFALGILLGYISYATDSMFCNTMLHAMFNSISGIIMIFASTDAVRKKSMDPNAVLTDGEQLILSFYAIFMIIVLLTALIGFIAMIKKLTKIKRYKLPKMWGEVGNGRKMAILIFTLPVLLFILLMTDVMGENYIADLIAKAVG